MLYEYQLKTTQRAFYGITKQVQEAIKQSGVTDGVAVVYCPHTTAGITINENADPDVPRDLLFALDKSLPDRPEFRHAEGNSQAHLLAMMTGTCQTLIVHAGRALLGTWQGVYFCEYDPPRMRKFYVQVIAG